jgi:glycosyltransferase involved in cell wall biosynthesis
MLRGADALISFTPHSNLLSLPIAWLAGVPVRIGTHHGHIEGSSNLLSWMHGRLTNSRICTSMVAVSAQVREYEIEREGSIANRIIVIENGIEPFQDVEILKRNRDQVRKQIGVETDTTLLLTVGRLTIQKGHTILLDAVPEIIKKHRKVKFVFAGEGPQKQALQAKVSELNLGDYVKFLGVRNEVPELLYAADIFVQPSLWEGLSLALLEALQAGLPVVATRVEGVVDVVEDGCHAILVAANDPAALAAGIEKLLGDASLRKGLSENGQERVKAHYSVNVMCSAYEKLINEARHAA